MERYLDYSEHAIKNRQNAFMDVFRTQNVKEYDRMYVNLLDTADVKELAGMVKRLRNDAVTLHFYKNVDADAVALKNDIELSQRQNDPCGRYLCSSTEPVILFHVFYAVERLLAFVRLTNDAEIEALLLRRMTTLLTEFKPPNHHFAELCENTNRLRDGLLSTLHQVAGEKMAHILDRMTADLAEVHRLERWMALVALFTTKRV